MAGLTMEIIGVPEVMANLEAFSKRTQIAVRRAAQESAKVALEVANAGCPVSQDGSHGNPPGFLRAGNAIRPASMDLSMWELYNDVYYCGFVVLGTYKMAAQDYMTPALDAGGAFLEARIAAIASV